MLDDTSVRIVVGGVGSLSYIACVLAIFLRNPSAYLDVFVGLCERVGFRARATDSPQAAGRQQSRETKEVGELRVQSFLGMSQLWMHVCGARIVFVFATGWIQSLPGRGFPSIIFLISYLACLVVNLRPGLVNSKTLPFLFHIGQGLIICIGLAMAIMDASLLVVHYGFFFVMRLSISLVYPVASSNACVNAVWVVLSTYAHLRTAPVFELDLVVETIVTEVFRCGFLTYWLWQLESSQTSQARSEFKASTYFTAKQTMERLLADMCDAVVELGPQLDIKEACPKLASLLLRHGSTTALRGEQFPQLTFGKEDREHFEEFVVQRTMPVELVESASNTAQASSLYLILKDANEFQIRLTPPLCKKQASFEFQADARVLCVEENAPASQLGVELPPGCDDEHREMLCLLELKNSQPKFLRSKRKSRKRPSKVETDSGLRKAFL